MAARSTGIFPREGFNLDNAFQLIHNGQITAPVNLSNCRTLRVILVGYVLTGNAVMQMDIGGVVFPLDANDFDANGVAIKHVRGYSCSDNDCLATPLENTGTITPGQSFVELVDGPAR